MLYESGLNPDQAYLLQEDIFERIKVRYRLSDRYSGIIVNFFRLYNIVAMLYPKYL